MVVLCLGEVSCELDKGWEEYKSDFTMNYRCIFKFRVSLDSLFRLTLWGHHLEPLLVQQLSWSLCFKMENVAMNQFKKRNHTNVLLNLVFL